MIRKIVFEGLAVFLLVFVTGMALNAEVKGLFFDMHFAKGSIAAILYGVFFYIGRRISGAHLNPAVSFGMTYTNQLKIGEVS
jgi:glycerol uptake facilitator-like aquaporin